MGNGPRKPASLAATNRVDAHKTLRSIRAVASALALVMVLCARVTAQSITLVPELTIGRNASEIQYQFDGIVLASATRSGLIFVSDGRYGQIRRYDASGRYRGSVGVPGQGPGEYQLPAGLGVSGDTSVVVLDPLNARIVVFDTAGQFRTSFSVPPVWNGVTRSLFMFDDGTVGVRTRSPTATASKQGSVLIRYSLDGRVADSMSLLPETRPLWTINSRSLGRLTAFHSTDLSVPLPGGGMAFASNARYRINVAPRGGQSFVVERTEEPIRLEGREREEWETLAGLANASGLGIALPRHKPFFRELFVDGQSRIWVDLYTRASYQRAEPAPSGAPNRTMWEHHCFDLFTANGRYLGRIELRPRSKLVAVEGNRIWVAAEEDDGSYVLIRYRMVGV